MIGIINMLCPEGLQNKFTKRSALSNYVARNMKNLHVQSPNLHKSMEDEQ